MEKLGKPYQNYHQILLLNNSGEFPQNTLRKHTYSNILKISLPRTERFQLNFDSFQISAQNIDSGYLLELPW